MTFEGEGSASSYIYQETVGQNGVNFTGASASSFGGYSAIRKMGILGTASGLGAGLTMNQLAYFEVDDVNIKGFGTGIYASNFLSSHIQRATLSFNNNGFRFERNAAATPNSSPNAITMIGCTVGNNYFYGGWVVGAGTFNYIGGSFEGNGTGTDLSTSKWGLRLTNAGGDSVGGQESSNGFALHGVYFEHNGGKAQCWVEQTVSRPGLTGILTGCSFNGIPGTISSHWVALEASDSSFTYPITFIGCGWWPAAGFSEDASRKTLSNGSNWWPVLTHGCNFAPSTNKYSPAIPTSSSSRGAQGSIIADASYVYVCVEQDYWVRYALSTF